MDRADRTHPTLRHCLFVAWFLLTLAVPAAAQQVTPAVEQACRAAAEHKAAGDLEAADESIRQALAQAPTSAEAWWLQAWIQLGLHHQRAALEAFRRAAELLKEGDPRRAKARRCVAALEQELPPVATTLQAPPPPPDLETFPLRFLLGWPLVLFGALFLVCGGAALGALREDAKLGEGGDAARFARLCPAAAEGQPRALAEVLRLGARPALGGLHPADLSGICACAAGTESGRQVLARVVSQSDGRARLAAATALAARPEQPDPRLWLPLAEGGDAALRACALEALGRAPVPEALPAFGEALRGPADLAGHALAGLAALGDAPALALLVTAAGQAAETASRERAVALLAGHGPLPAELAPELAALAADPAAPGRPELVRALAATGQEALPAVIERLLDHQGEVREAALAALRRAAPSQGERPRLVAPLAAVLAEDPARAELEALALLNEWDPAGAVAPLAAVAKAGDIARAAAAVARLTENTGPEAAEALGAVLRQLPAELAAAPAATPLVTALCQAAVTRRLVEALPDVLRLGPATRLEAARRAALFLAEQPDSGAVLATAAADRDPRVRQSAVALLAGYPRAEAAEPLLAELSRAGSPRTDWRTLENAATALGQLREERALEPLRALHERYEELRGDRIDVALARLGDGPARARVEAMLVRPDWAGRRPAAAFFHDLPELPPRAAAVVAEERANRTARRLERDGTADPAALAALGESVRPTLEEWLDEPSRRRVAAAALAALGDDGAGALAEAMDELDRLSSQDGDASEEIASLLQRHGARLAAYRARAPVPEAVVPEDQSPL